MKSTASILLATLAAGALVPLSGCGSVFNPAFLNSVTGGVVPVTPGPNAAFVMVRGRNDTAQTVEFIVTIEREVLVIDDDGNFQIDDQGDFVTRPQRETVRLQTLPTGLANELGVLFPCGESPVTVVGLGANLLPTDAVVFVGGAGAGGGVGFGITGENLNPLSLNLGNFNCGDTIIYRAFTNPSVPGGVSLASFLLPGSEQPNSFAGPDTFANLQAFLEAQSVED